MVKFEGLIVCESEGQKDVMCKVRLRKKLSDITHEWAKGKKIFVEYPDKELSEVKNNDE